MHWSKLALMGVVGSLSSIAGAQENETLQIFTRGDFTSALTAIGATYQQRDDARNLDITFESNIRADGLLLACEDEATERNCYGTSMLATFTAIEGTSDETIDAAINEYNYQENFGRAYRDPSGTISVRMYIISDGGITRDNYQRQISLWVASLNDFFGYLYGDDQAN